MLKGVKVLLYGSCLALFVFLVNVIMVDDFLYNLTSQVALDPSSKWSMAGMITKFAQLETFLPILILLLSAGYYLFSRVFGQESQDWIT
jgi:hypothetical protein